MLLWVCSTIPNFCISPTLQKHPAVPGATGHAKLAGCLWPNICAFAPKWGKKTNCSCYIKDIKDCSSLMFPIETANCMWVWVNTYRYNLVGWTSIYQLFWCSPGVQGFDTLPCGIQLFLRTKHDKTTMFFASWPGRLELHLVQWHSVFLWRCQKWSRACWALKWWLMGI